MPLEVYFKSDLAQSTTAITVAMLSSAIAHGGTNREYVRGVLDTARVHALNYGIPWTSVVRDVRVTLRDNGLLDDIARGMLEGGG